MNAEAALRELRRTRAPIAEVTPPSVPGVYAWFLRTDGYIGPFSARSDEPVYVGRSIDLAERSLGNHFKSGETGWSTLRRSLGAIMKDDLRLRAIPRSASLSKSNLRHYRFDDLGEDALTVWMQANLDFGFCPSDDPEGLENDVLELAAPMLNLRDCPNPHAKEIRRLRGVCAKEAAEGA